MPRQGLKKRIPPQARSGGNLNDASRGPHRPALLTGGRDSIIQTMAFGSRIQSPTLGRALVAVAMIVVLAGSTGLAMLISQVRNPDLGLDWVTEQVGSFSYERPADWQRTASTEGDTLIEYNEPPPGLRRMRVLEWQFTSPRPPAESLNITRQRLTPASRFSIYRTLHVGDLAAALFIGGSRGQMGRQRVVQKDLLLSVTADGLRHMVICISGLGPPRSSDDALLTHVAGSARDIRYAPTDTVTFPSLKLSAPLPPTVVARAPTGDTDESGVLLLPAGDGRLAQGAFWRIWARPLELTTLREELASELAKLGADDSVDVHQVDADRVIRALLAHTFEQMHEQPPDQQLLQSQATDDRVIHRIILAGGQANTMYQSLWVVRLDDERALLLDCLAEPRAAKLIEFAAAQLTERVGDMAQGDTEPAAPDEAAPPPDASSTPAPPSTPMRQNDTP